MDKYITDERTELRYELIGDIYYIAEDDDQPEEETEPIGIWGQRHLRFIKQHRYSLFLELLASGRLNSYLADVDRQAENMFFRLVNELAESGVLSINQPACGR